MDAEQAHGPIVAARASRPRCADYHPGVHAERPIGMFDSGVGGLTVLHECLVTMPHEDFLYAGDTARFPYGGRSAERAARLRARDRRLARARGRQADRRRLQLGHGDRAAAICSATLDVP